MRILVTWCSKRGGTEGIGQALGEALRAHGFDVVARPVNDVRAILGFDAIILGGALYANRWPLGARRFVKRHLRHLRQVPVWFFSSGPLDASADATNIPPPPEVAVLAERVGAKGHMTCGGRLAADAQGFPARAMAKTHSGDWRNFDRIRAWASELASQLPTAVAGTPVAHPARAMSRVLTHAVVGWALCALTMVALLQTVSLTAALVLHAIAAPVFFAGIAVHYFKARGARDPVPVALIWTGIVVALDVVVVAGLVQRDVSMFRSVLGTWLPVFAIFAVTWATGEMMSMMPTSPPRAASVHAM